MGKPEGMTPEGLAARLACSSSTEAGIAMLIRAYGEQERRRALDEAADLFLPSVTMRCAWGSIAGQIRALAPTARKEGEGSGEDPGQDSPG